MTTDRATTAGSLIEHTIEVTYPDGGLARGASTDVQHTVVTLNAEPWRVYTAVRLSDPDVSVPPVRAPGGGTWIDVLPALLKFAHSAKRVVRLADTPITVAAAAAPPDRDIDVTVHTHVTPVEITRPEQLGDMHVFLPIVTQ